MLNKNAKAWIAALKSGKYRQARRVLTKLDEEGNVVGHCCLGVACELAVKAGVIPQGKPGDDGYLIYDGEHFRLPHSVRSWLGLAGMEGELAHQPGDPTCLSSMNDKGDTFDMIAEVIESEPEGLFV